ncbi:hypothetical protein, partial [Vibrio sinaloensis]
MSERSVELAKQSISGASKYDYFIVGIAAATFAYFAKDFSAENSFGLNENSLVILALLLQAASIVSGLKKIERYNEFLQRNGKYLDYSEHLAGYKKVAIEGISGINKENGEILTPEESAIKAASLEKLLPKWKSELESRSKIISISGT